MADRPIVIANCSGFYGDRLSAAREMVEGGPIDVLTGDWLAELTMLILWKAKARNADAGYAATFLTHMEQVLGSCVDRGIKVVTNAGGLNPAGCAERVREIADRLGLEVAVAHIEGDDLMDRIDGLRPQLNHLDTGAPLTVDPVSANAYLGGWGIALALREGADVVICPRVTDAALVVGPAAWWWDWVVTDWDRLAGAVAAGHVIECGPQATGGNFSFFTELGDLPGRPPSRPLGFPIAEVAEDGSSVITKHPGTGGRVTVETVTAQLLYEIGAPAYPNPDVVARFDTSVLSEVAPDRVRISGTRGEPAPPTTKVAINYEGGFRNRMTFVLTGLDQDAKRAWLTSALVEGMGGADALVSRGVTLDVRFVPIDPGGVDQERASGLLHVTAKGPDDRSVGRAFSSAAIELALGNIPGFFATSTPGPAAAYGVYWPALVPVDEVPHTVVLAECRRLEIEPSPTGPEPEAPIVAPTIETAPLDVTPGEPLGRWFGARSGDKGGNANVGIWARDDAGYAWLAAHLTADRVRELLPEIGDRPIHRYELANLRALNFVLVGYLGEGVASSTSFDPQAKGLGEYLRSRPA